MQNVRYVIVYAMLLSIMTFLNGRRLYQMPKIPFKWFVVDRHTRDNDAARRRSYTPTTKQSTRDFKIGLGALVILIILCKIFGII